MKNLQKMNSDKKIARIVGVLYIIGTIAGILSLVFTDPIRDGQNILANISANENRMILGALSIVTMGLALSMIPVLMYPILKKYNQTLALGYIVFRSGFEAVTHLSIAIGWLLLLPLSRAYTEAGTPDVPHFHALGSILLNPDQIGSIGTIVFCLATLMFYFVLFQSKLVPRWLSGWGLIAVIPYLVGGLLSIFGLIDPLATITVVLDVPLALQEMVLAVWLIVKGFRFVA